MCCELIKSQEEELGPDHLKTIDMKNNYASILSHLNRFEEAEKYWFEVIKAREKVLGPNDQSTLQV